MTWHYKARGGKPWCGKKKGRTTIILSDVNCDECQIKKDEEWQRLFGSWPERQLK